MRSPVYEQIKSAIHNGFPEKAVSILNAHRQYLSKNELRKIFYLGMWTGVVFEWFLNNIDEYRSYLDDHHKRICDLTFKDSHILPRIDEVDKRREAERISGAQLSFERIEPYNQGMEKFIIKKGYHLQIEFSNDAIQYAIYHGNRRLLKNILKNSDRDALKLSCHFILAYDYSYNRTWEIVKYYAARDKNDNPNIYEYGLGGELATDRDPNWQNYAKKHRTVHKSFDMMKIVYRYMNPSKRHGSLMHILDLLHSYRDDMHRFVTYLLLKQKWIDLSWTDHRMIDSSYPNVERVERWPFDDKYFPNKYVCGDSNIFRHVCDGEGNPPNPILTEEIPFNHAFNIHENTITIRVDDEENTLKNFWSFCEGFDRHFSYTQFPTNDAHPRICAFFKGFTREFYRDFPPTREIKMKLSHLFPPTILVIDRNKNTETCILGDTRRRWMYGGNHEAAKIDYNELLEPYMTRGNKIQILFRPGPIKITPSPVDNAGYISKIDSICMQIRIIIPPEFDY